MTNSRNILLLIVLLISDMAAAEDGVQVFQQGYSQSDGTIYVVFEVKNLSNKKVQFRCTESGSAMIDYYSPNGNGFSKLGGAYCGVGATTMIIEPRTSGYFPIVVWSVKAGAATLSGSLVDGSMIGLYCVFDGEAHERYFLSDVVTLRYDDAVRILEKR